MTAAATRTEPGARLTRTELVAVRATDADMAHVDVAIHESGLAVGCVLLGGRVRTAVVTRPGATGGPGGFTKFVGLTADGHADVGFAGPWAQARWQAGRRPTMREVNAAVDGTSHLDRKLITAGGGLCDVGHEIPTLLERAWPAVLEVMAKLWKHGEVHHTDVLDALNLTEANAPMGLPLIRSGAAPGSFRLNVA